jgi:signal transduction histidine kinase/CheY-like chemotaxis protein
LTENLLEQSQSQAEELRSQQEELRESNEDLGRQARLLAEQNIEAERRNQEVEQSNRLVEEKAGELGQLAVSSKYKSEFIANMSHELRTPLNSLLILAEQLEDNPDGNMTPKQVQYASVIGSSGKELLNLLNSILDLAKVESGTFTIEMTDLSLDELRNALIREFEQVAVSKGIGYSIDIATDCPDLIVTDPQRLRQVLKNLLANAFKFTEHGQVHVQVRAADRGWNPDKASLADATSVVAVSVRDTGIGIEPEQQQRIFEAFAQGDGSTARLYGGTGLGLSISRELVGLLGGDLSVTSTPGSGSTFTVYLPVGLRAADAPSAAPALTGGVDESIAAGASTAEPAPQPDQRPEPRELHRSNGLDDSVLSGAKVLLVDDDFRNIFALTALLERGHAVVTVAESGSEALATLDRNRDIDIVLMDIMMPIMDGYDAIRAIRRFDHFKDLPIIAVTGKVVVGERLRCMEAGANDYVPKPVDVDQLLAALSPWLPVAAQASR